MYQGPLKGKSNSRKLSITTKTEGREMARQALKSVFAAEVESLCGPRHRPGQEGG
jgi:hypothetical protein